jgi:hypothetical protein
VVSKRRRAQWIGLVKRLLIPLIQGRLRDQMGMSKLVIDCMKELRVMPVVKG